MVGAPARGHAHTTKAGKTNEPVRRHPQLWLAPGHRQQGAAVVAVRQAVPPDGLALTLVTLGLFLVAPQHAEDMQCPHFPLHRTPRFVDARAHVAWSRLW